MGITLEIGQEMNDDNNEYICPSFTSDTPLVSSASLGSPTSPVINEPCVDFQWRDKDGKPFCKLIGNAIKVLVHWRHNSFVIPSGKAGKDFILEPARMYQAYAEDTTLHSITFTACCVSGIAISEASCQK